MVRKVIIVAGGSGARMGSKIPKQFMVLGSKPVLMHTIETFYNAGIKDIIVVIPLPLMEYWKQLCKDYSFSIIHEVVAGGLFRSESVANGLSVIKDKEAMVAVHDGVRPFASAGTIMQAFELAEKEGTAVPYLDITDSLRKMEGISHVVVDRDKYKTLQTPQCFQLWMLKKAYKGLQWPSFTDDAALVESMDIPIHLFKGNPENIKLTTPLDWIVAESILTAKSNE